MSSSSATTRDSTASVGAVVIGLNEGDRLRASLESVLPQVRATVYVDSGSTDGSMELAARMGAGAVPLGMETAYTAARARNVGWRRLLESNAGIEYVQFVDGDCVLDASWIEKAIAEFATKPRTAILYGHVRETWPDRNVYHRLAAIEWDTPVGPTKYCGGIAMMRCAALLEVGGYRDDLVAGEEPELCVRVRQAGWSIVKLDEEMASHDSDIGSFKSWWRRSVRSGRAYAEGASLHGEPPERHWTKEIRGIWFWGLAVPLLGVALAWPTGGTSLAIACAMYLVLFAKIALDQFSTGKSKVSDVIFYAMFCVVVKWPQAIGILSYHGRRLAGSGRSWTELEIHHPARKDRP